MEYRENTLKFVEMVEELSKSLIIPFQDSKQQKELGESLMSTILGNASTKPIKHINSPKEDFIANKLFRPMWEILLSMQSIENIRIYAKRFPYKRQNVSRYSYLRYHIENYLNEVYLLHNRLKAYLALIEKAYKKSSFSNNVLTITEPLKTVVEISLENLLNMRGYHVHEYRYTDKELDRLSTLELFSESSNEFGPLINVFYIRAYKDIRKAWVVRINNDIDAISTLLEYYFHRLMLAISKDGKILFPDHIT